MDLCFYAIPAPRGWGATFPFFDLDFWYQKTHVRCMVKNYSINGSFSIRSSCMIWKLIVVQKLQQMNFPLPRLIDSRRVAISSHNHHFGQTHNLTMERWWFADAPSWGQEQSSKTDSAMLRDWIEPNPLQRVQWVAEAARSQRIWMNGNSMW